LDRRSLDCAQRRENVRRLRVAQNVSVMGVYIYNTQGLHSTLLTTGILPTAPSTASRVRVTSQWKAVS
jgi:hypothetical protein